MAGPLARLHPEPDYLSQHVRATGDYFEAAILDYLHRTYLPTERRLEQVIVDAGAMLGNHAHYFATYLPCSLVYAFEPLELNLELLRANVEGLAVIVLPVALSDSDRVGRMALPGAENRGHARLLALEEGPADAEVVSVRRLDDYHLDVGLLKIDTEGHEAAVLRGAQLTIERTRPWLLVEDWSGAHPPAGYTLRRSWGTEHQTYLYVPEGERG